MSKKKNNKSSKINKELNKFIKDNKDQIVSKGREDLGADLSEKRLITLFKANYKERMEGKKQTLAEARKAMQRTLHTETFTGRKQINFENVRKSLIENKEWETFRHLNRHQKIDMDKLSITKAPSGSNIRERWVYSANSKRTIYIDLIYHSDASYSWDVHI